MRQCAQLQITECNVTDQATPVVPTGINLHQKSRLLEIAFSDGFSFNYPCEYLRISTDQGTPVHGKKQVDFQAIEPQDTEALQINFNDGYSCTCSWDSLHDLGVNYKNRWQSYLQQLEDNGLKRGDETDGKVAIKVLYFIKLAIISGKDEEDLDIPASVTDVASLLAWLRKRGDDWKEAFAEERVQVTVNKHFAEPFTLIEGGDEVAIVPRP
jgi:DUF971 family protein/molybdopterin converting factor small subunit